MPSQFAAIKTGLKPRPVCTSSRCTASHKVGGRQVQDRRKVHPGYLHRAETSQQRFGITWLANILLAIHKDEFKEVVRPYLTSACPCRRNVRVHRRNEGDTCLASGRLGRASTE